MAKSYINKLNRLKDYNYNTPGAYFVTICTGDRKCFFGEIVNEEMELNAAGKIAEKCWREIPEHFENTELYEYVVMPNHVHGIIALFDDNFKEGEDKICKDIVGQRHAFDLQIKRMHEKIPLIIGSYKSSVSRFINKYMPDIGFKWQSSYFDHIVRNEKALENISDYIRINPLKWKEDLENEKYLKNMRKHERNKLTREFYKTL